MAHGYTFPVNSTIELGHPETQRDIFRGGNVIGIKDGEEIVPDSETVELINGGWVHERATRQYGFWVTVEDGDAFYYEFYETNNGFRQFKKLRVDELDTPKYDEARRKLEKHYPEYDVE